MSESDFITTAELRQITGYRLQSLARAVREGDLPQPKWIGRQLFWPRTAMTSLLNGLRKRVERTNRADHKTKLHDRLDAFDAAA